MAGAASDASAGVAGAAASPPFEFQPIACVHSGVAEQAAMPIRRQAEKLARRRQRIGAAENCFDREVAGAVIVIAGDAGCRALKRSCPAQVCHSRRSRCRARATRWLLAATRTMPHRDCRRTVRAEQIFEPVAAFVRAVEGKISGSRYRDSFGGEAILSLARFPRVECAGQRFPAIDWKDDSMRWSPRQGRFDVSVAIEARYRSTGEAIHRIDGNSAVNIR